MEGWKGGRGEGGYVVGLGLGLGLRVGGEWGGSRRGRWGWDGFPMSCVKFKKCQCRRSLSLIFAYCILPFQYISQLQFSIVEMLILRRKYSCFNGENHFEIQVLETDICLVENTYFSHGRNTKILNACLFTS